MCLNVVVNLSFLGGFGRLVGQNETSDDITSGSRKLRSAFKCFLMIYEPNDELKNDLRINKMLC